jgi:hypothetical protein
MKSGGEVIIFFYVIDVHDKQSSWSKGISQMKSKQQQSIQYQPVMYCGNACGKCMQEMHASASDIMG